MDRMVPLLAAALAILAAMPAAGAPKRIAVLEFHGYATLQPQEVAYLTDLVRSVAIGLPSDQYYVMTRENLRDSLPPGRDLADCEGQCEIETGRNVGADLVVSGEVITFGSHLKVSIKLHDTRTSALKAQQSASAPDVDHLEQPTRAAAVRLFEVLPGGEALSRGLVQGLPTGGGAVMEETPGPAPRPVRPEPRAAPQETTVLYVQTVPEGATVQVDGRVAGKTPYQDLEMTPGRHVVTVQYGDLYYPETWSGEVPPQGKRLTLQLKPHFGSVRIETVPAGAECSLDGVTLPGKTPLTREQQVSRTYRVVCGAPDYFRAEQAVEVRDGQQSLVRLTLEANFGRLDVDSNPPGAEVYLDGSTVSVGKTPLLLERAPLGGHDVRLVKVGYREHVGQAMVGSSQEPARVRAELEPVFGTLRVSAVRKVGDEERPVEADVWVDGGRVGTTPWQDRRLIGPHVVRIKAPEGEAGPRTVEVKEGRTETVAFAVEDARNRPAVVPTVGAGAGDGGRSARRSAGIALTTIGSASLVGGLIAHVASYRMAGEAVDALDRPKYDRARTGYYVAYALYGLGVLGEVIGISLLATLPKEAPRSEGAGRPVAGIPMPVVSPGMVGATWNATF